jgi:hypothetical protein
MRPHNQGNNAYRFGIESAHPKPFKRLEARNASFPSRRSNSGRLQVLWLRIYVPNDAVLNGGILVCKSDNKIGLLG